MSSIQPRKQRKAMYDAPHHVARKAIASHLAEPLLLKYNRRSLTVIQGDEVKVLRGDHAGKTGKVANIDVPARKLIIDGVTHKKADGTQVPLPVHASNVLITKLNLEDKRRRAKLGEGDEKAAKAEAKAGNAPKAPKAAKGGKTEAAKAAGKPPKSAEKEASA